MFSLRKWYLVPLQRLGRIIITLLMAFKVKTARPPWLLSLFLQNRRSSGAAPTIIVLYIFYGYYIHNIITYWLSTSSHATFCTLLLFFNFSPEMVFSATVPLQWLGRTISMAFKVETVHPPWLLSLFSKNKINGTTN